MPAKHGWKYYHYFTKDNPKLPNLEKALAEAKAGLTDREYRAEYEASWEDFAGQIFDYLEDRHILHFDTRPENFEFCCIGIDWGDINPAIVVVGIKDYPYKYYVLESWKPNQGLSVPFDNVKRKAYEFALKYNIHSTYPDVFQPGNQNFINELRQMPHPGLQNICVPGSEDYQNMRLLRVMPSCAQINRLIKADRFFINVATDLGDKFRSYRRNEDKNGQFIDEPHPACDPISHEIDATRYVVANIDHTLSITYGGASHDYSPFAYSE